MFALCFSGSGCLATYQFGVAQCLLKHGHLLLSKCSHVVGCSGGSLVAAVLVHAPHRLEDAVHLSLHCKNHAAVEKALSLAGTVGFPETDGAPKLVVSTATLSSAAKEVQFSQFQNKQELLNCLRASCHIPKDFHPLDMLSPFRSSYADGHLHQGLHVMDGGFAAAIPKIPNAHNILVSPMSGPGIHICPHEAGSARWFSKRLGGQRFYVNVENVRRAGISMVGGPLAMMEAYLQDGFRDCERFLKQENLYQV